MGLKCPTGKKQFPGLIEVHNELRRVQARRLRRGDSKIESGYYRCRKCRKWHLTSMPQQGLTPSQTV